MRYYHLDLGTHFPRHPKGDDMLTKRSTRNAKIAIALGSALMLTSGYTAVAADKSDDDAWRENGFTSVTQLKDAAVKNGLTCPMFVTAELPLTDTESLTMGICNPEGDDLSDGVMVVNDNPIIIKTLAEGFLEDPEMKIDTVLVGKNWLLAAPDAAVPQLYYNFFGDVMTRDEKGVPSLVPEAGRKYSSLTNLRDATVAAGLHCPKWELGESNSASIKPGACYTEKGDFILSYYWVDDPSLLPSMAASTGDDPILIGPNWLLWAEQPELIALLAPTMGGQMGLAGE